MKKYIVPFCVCLFVGISSMIIGRAFHACPPPTNEEWTAYQLKYLNCEAELHWANNHIARQDSTIDSLRNKEAE